VTSFATTTSLAPERIRDAVNAMLGPELVVRRASDAPAGFDARFSATAREYRYAIATGDVADPFTARYVWHRPGPLHVPSMRHAAAALVGEHDFASFCRNPGRGRSTVRDLRRVAVRRDGDLVAITFRANAFLHQMVRSLVGTLVMVGTGRLEPDGVEPILAARDRLAAPHRAAERPDPRARVLRASPIVVRRPDAGASGRLMLLSSSPAGNKDRRSSRLTSFHRWRSIR
jgi:tRNA pseudouridine38-40 synthase